MQTTDLIAETEDLLQQVKARIEKLDAVEPTQLRLVVNRLRLFLEQHPEPEAGEEKPKQRRGKPKTEDAAEPEAGEE